MARWPGLDGDFARIEISGHVCSREHDSYRMEITGPAAEGIGPHLGPQVGPGFPERLSALVERAAR